MCDEAQNKCEHKINSYMYLNSVRKKSCSNKSQLKRYKQAMRGISMLTSSAICNRPSLSCNNKLHKRIFIEIIRTKWNKMQIIKIETSGNSRRWNQQSILDITKDELAFKVRDEYIASIYKWEMTLYLHCNEEKWVRRCINHIVGTILW